MLNCGYELTWIRFRHDGRGHREIPRHRGRGESRPRRLPRACGDDERNVAHCGYTGGPEVGESAGGRGRGHPHVHLRHERGWQCEEDRIGIYRAILAFPVPLRETSHGFSHMEAQRRRGSGIGI